MKNKRTESKANLVVRTATAADIPQMQALMLEVYPGLPNYKEAHLRGQQGYFPEGQIVVELNGKLVGFCSTFQVRGEKALEDHTWSEITGQGFASSHDVKGDYLYGFEVVVAPNVRGQRIGKRLYDARKQLCQAKNLKGIIIVGRLPGLRKNFKKLGSAKAYVERVLEKKIRDRVFLFQTKNGFEPVRTITGYLPSDEASMGCGQLMVWKNPEYRDGVSKTGKIADGFPKQSVRIATVQYKQRRVESFEQFLQYIEYFVDVAADYDADFVLFPEWITMQLLSLEKKKVSPAQSIRHLASYTDRYRDALKDMALQYDINIIGGSTATIRDDNVILNTSFVFHRDGRIDVQDKIHATPNEVFWWGLGGGDTVRAIDSDVGPIGILICYDSEFPELARYLVDQGIKILFVPFCTDERKSYLRVRYCCQARAIENQIYVAMSGNVGNLPGVDNMDIQYAQSCILTPSDFPFARDGIAADTTPNVETVSFADVRLDDLQRARDVGTVQNLKDRRHDLYHVSWSK